MTYFASCMYKTSLALSAVKKMLEAFGGELSMREHHDLKDDGASTHLIMLSIPCRLPAANHDTANDYKHDIWGHSESKSMANVKDIVNVARQMNDFGMDTLNDDWFELTVDIFAQYSMKIKRVADEVSCINLYRVIFVSSAERFSELLALGYKGQLVMVTAQGQVPVGYAEREYILEVPYTLDAMDNFFRSISQCQKLSRQPKLLTTLNRIVICLKPHERIPIVSWTIHLLHALNQWKLSSIVSDRFPPSSSSSSSSSKYPVTSAYTPISSSASSISSTVSEIEDVDYEYLTNNKIVTSTSTHETIQIADNFLDESLFADMTASVLSKT